MKIKLEIDGGQQFNTGLEECNLHTKTVLSENLEYLFLYKRLPTMYRKF
jgi:hypothetical protein